MRRSAVAVPLLTVPIVDVSCLVGPVLGPKRESHYPPPPSTPLRSDPFSTWLEGNLVLEDEIDSTV